MDFNRILEQAELITEKQEILLGLTYHAERIIDKFIKDPKYRMKNNANKVNMTEIMIDFMNANATLSANMLASCIELYAACMENIDITKPMTEQKT